MDNDSARKQSRGNSAMSSTADNYFVNPRGGIRLHANPQHVCDFGAQLLTKLQGAPTCKNCALAGAHTITHAANVTLRIFRNNSRTKPRDIM